MLLLNILQCIVLVLLGLATLYIFIFSFAGLFYKQKAYATPSAFKKMAVLIPGYKEDEVIIEVAESALMQSYPTDFYDVVIIADSFEKETLVKLREMPIKLVEVSFEKSTKAKALNKAMQQLDNSYDIAVILDADNLMEKDFLKKINASFEGNFIAVQGHRTAKNLNNSWAILDAISEEINNNIFRKGHRVTGLSSAIIGSGMAFKYGYFKDLMADAKAVGGFDKEIELRLLKAGHKIEYLDDAIVYDEKIQKSDVFGNQRRRWLSAQLHYFRQDFLTSLQHLFLKGNVDYFDKAIQFIQPPRVLLLGAVMLSGSFFVLINYLLKSHLFLYSWLVLATACLLSFLFAVPRAFFNAGTLKALVSLPKGMLVMLVSLLKIKGANQKFIHTKHTATVSKVN